MGAMVFRDGVAFFEAALQSGTDDFRTLRNETT